LDKTTTTQIELERADIEALLAGESLALPLDEDIQLVCSATGPFTRAACRAQIASTRPQPGSGPGADPDLSAAPDPELDI
jgi:hypothetical protein